MEGGGARCGDARATPLSKQTQQATLLMQAGHGLHWKRSTLEKLRVRWERQTQQSRDHATLSDP
eukprot:1464569-Rhodomonas_salina.1